MGRGIGAAAVLLLFVAGCSTSSATKAKHAVFVSAFEGHAAAVEWTNNGGALSNVSIRSADVDAAAANGVREKSLTGSGVITGNIAKLNVDGGPLMGALSKSHLTLTLPGTDQPLRLALASMPKFDHALVLLRLEGGDAAKTAAFTAGRAAAQQAVDAAAKVVTADHEALIADVGAIDHPGALTDHADKMQTAGAALAPLVAAVRLAAKPGKCSAAKTKAAAVDSLYAELVAEAAAFAADVKSMSVALVDFQQHSEKVIVDLRSMNSAATYGVAPPEKPSAREISKLLSDGDSYAAATKQSLARNRPRESQISTNARLLQKQSELIVRNCSAGK